MKVIDKKKKETTSFYELFDGVVFGYNGLHYIKVWNGAAKETFAVCLESGDLCPEIDDETVVEPLNVELHIVD